MLRWSSVTVPPDFFAPRRFPGPSFAPLARPCASEVECLTAVLGLATQAGCCERRRLDSAVSIDVKHDCAPAAGARNRGSSIVVVCRGITTEVEDVARAWDEGSEVRDQIYAVRASKFTTAAGTWKISNLPGITDKRSIE